MHPRLQKTCLWITSESLLVCSLGVIGWGLFWPSGTSVGIPSTSEWESNTRTLEQPSTAAKTLSTADFEGFWDKRLQQDWTKSSPSGRESVASKQTSPTLKVKLVGTVIEPGQSLAMFSTPAGTIALKRVGEQLGDIAPQTTLIDITSQKVVLRYQGTLVELALEGAERN